MHQKRNVSGAFFLGVRDFHLPSTRHESGNEVSGVLVFLPPQVLAGSCRGIPADVLAHPRQSIDCTVAWLIPVCDGRD
ncbi:MAG: hypothetical protein P8J33_16995 [Pirellulaceae bacterium]|nr:hypothetical protein [Pirellulaceae bacterium]